MQTPIKNLNNINYRETLNEKTANIALNLIRNSKSSGYIKSTIGEYKNCNNAEAISAGFISHGEIIGKTDAELGWKRSANTLTLNDSIVINGRIPITLLEKGIFNRKLTDVLTKKFPIVDNKGNVIALLGLTIPAQCNDNDLISFNKISAFINCIYSGIFKEPELSIINLITKSIPQKRIIVELDISQSTITKKKRLIYTKLGLEREEDLFVLFPPN